MSTFHKQSYVLFPTFPTFFREFSGENQKRFEFFRIFSAFLCLSEKIYFIKCSTFLARFPSILKSREDYFSCTFPLLLLKSMKKHEKAQKSTKKHDKVKCRFSWWCALHGFPASTKKGCSRTSATPTPALPPEMQIAWPRVGDMYSRMSWHRGRTLCKNIMCCIPGGRRTWSTWDDNVSLLSRHRIRWGRR